MIARYNPSHCLLVGIAGTYVRELEIGTAATFSSVGCYGVGVGWGEDFQTAGQMGWQQWAEAEDRGSVKEQSAIGDTLDLFVPEVAAAGQLLTVTSAAASEAEVLHRRELFPSAVAEDMEGFGVAAACRLAEVPLTIVRGFSNRAGDRHHANWQIESAMKAAVSQVETILVG